MKKYCWIIVLLLSCSLVMGVTMPKGAKELAVEGLFDSDAFDGDEFDLTILYGEYFDDNMESGLQLAVHNSDHVTQLRGGIRFEFNNQNYEVVPFVAITLEYASADIEEAGSGGDTHNRDTDAFVGGAHTGLKYFIAENIAISGSLIYEWASEDIFEEKDSELKENNVLFRLGMRFLF